MLQHSCPTQREKYMITTSEVNFTDKTNSNDQSVDFLPSGIPVPKDKVKEIGNKEIGTIKESVTSEVPHDIVTLTPTELRRKYPRTYKCWDNMKQRKHRGAIIHLEFDKFPDFLRHLGPCENPKYTLDRLDNDDPEYAPGKVKWRDKHAQNSNKGNNIFLTHDDGRKHTIAQWAKITNQNSSTLYKRHKSGWSAMEIITGKRTGIVFSVNNNPWPHQYQGEWESKYFDARVNGHRKSKIEFLREEAANILDDCYTRIYKLETAVEYKEENVDYHSIPRVHKYNLEYIGYDHDSFSEASLREVKEHYQRIKNLMSRCEKVLQETGEQILYQQRKKELLRYNGTKSADNPLTRRFSELYPEPVYTINKPPGNPIQE